MSSGGRRRERWERGERPAREGGRTGVAGPLGKSAKLPSAPSRKKQRRERLRLLRSVRRLLPEQRVASCCHHVTHDAVDIESRRGEGDALRARLLGVMTCGSVWACPVCAAKIARQRAGELDQLLRVARERGVSPYLLTLTLQHSRGEPLEAVLKRLQHAMRRFRGDRASPFRALRKLGVLEGTVQVVEILDGLRHGWHPHYHLIVLLREDGETSAAVAEARDALTGYWPACVEAAGGWASAKHGATLQDGRATGDYVAKWGLAQEMTASTDKDGRGRHPFELVRLGLDRDDAQARARFVEFAEAMRGRQQLRWSPDLKAWAGVEQVSDAAAAEDAEPVEPAEPVVWVSIPADVWYSGWCHRAADLLDACESGADPPEALVRAVRWADGWDAYGRADRWRANAGAGVPFSRSRDTIWADIPPL